jgi:hypothetical protein
MRLRSVAGLVSLACLACSCAFDGHAVGTAPSASIASIPSLLSSSPGLFGPGLEGARELLSQGEKAGEPAAISGGFRLQPEARRLGVMTEALLEVTAPDTADGELLLKLRGVEREVGVRRSGAGRGVAGRRGKGLFYQGASEGLDALVFAVDEGFEDLVLVRDERATLTYELRLPEGWSLAPGRLRDSVEIRNRGGLAAITMSAPACWSADGAMRTLSLALDGTTVGVRASDGTDERPLGSCRVVDPGFQPTTPALDAVVGNVVVALPTGKVLLSGGRTGSEGTELDSLWLYDPYSGDLGYAGADGPLVMSRPRAYHTGTLLHDGRVLLAGGEYKPTGMPVQNSLLDLYDARSRTLESVQTKEPDWKWGITDSTATLVPDGRVILIGGSNGGGSINSIFAFEPKTNGFSKLGKLAWPREKHVAVLMPSGNIVVSHGVSRSGEPDLYLGHPERIEPATGASTEIGPSYTYGLSPSATLLSNGDLLIAGGQFAAEAAPKTTSNTVCTFVPSGTQDFVKGSAMNQSRRGHTATRMPSGNVVAIGGETTGQIKAELYVPGTGDWHILSGPSVLHELGASSLLPSGDVLVAGGNTSENLLFSEPPALSAEPIGSALFPTGARAATLLDGRVLLTAPDAAAPGGGSPLGLFDPGTGAVSDGPEVPNALGRSPLVVLADGRVLFPGGGSLGGDPFQATGEARLFDPATGSVATTGSLGAARHAHTATLLNDGRVLVAGGFDPALQDHTDSVELYDPASGTFEAGPKLIGARMRHTATPLPNGDVLIAGGSSPGNAAFATAEIYSAADGTFKPTGAMVQPRSRHAAVVLPDGSTLVLGGSSSGPSITSIERYDPATGKFSQVGAMARARSGHTATLLPSGKVLIGGGFGVVDSAYKAFAELELLDTRTWTSAIVGSLSVGRDFPAATLSPTGEVVFVGGALAPPERYAPLPVLDALRPRLTKVPSSLVVSTPSTLGGEQLDGLPGAGTNTYFGGDSRAPVAVFLPFVGGMLVGGVSDWSAGNLSYRPPSSSLRGPGMLFIVTSGVPSLGKGSSLVAGPIGVSCAQDTDCEGGRCVDGVCCDTACDDPCMACSSALKGSGADGQCGPVAQGKAHPSKPCVSAEDPLGCGTINACDGAGQCALAPKGKACSAPTCSKDADGVEVASPASTCDGAGACVISAATPCPPYRCDGQGGACTKSCSVSEDCSSGIAGTKVFCKKGQCLYPLDNGKSCGEDADCASEHCADGYCCDTACSEQCAACNVSGREGTCSPIPQGEPPRGDRKPCAVVDVECGGSCNGELKTCAFPPNDAPCGASSCTGGRNGTAYVRRCIGNGVCGPNQGTNGSAGTPCSPYACGATACLTSCERDEQCIEGHSCKAGKCEADRENSCAADGVTSVTIDGKSQDCRPYRCGSNGACLSSCKLTGDCAVGARCTSSFVCVPADDPGAPTDDAGCGCRQAPSSSPGWAGLGALALAAGALARRRGARR